MHEVDEVLTLSQKRVEEINSTPLGVFVEPLHEEKKPKKKSKKDK